jgi:hypothetical protein
VQTGATGVPGFGGGRRGFGGGRSGGLPVPGASATPLGIGT